MDYKNILIKLELLREKANRCMTTDYSSSEHQALKDDIAILYGELEEVITRIAGIRKILVPATFSDTAASEYPNFIEAGFLSNRGEHAYQGYRQLLKIIGRVRQLAEDPSLPKSEPSISSLIDILYRFRECCKYINPPPSKEEDVQNILWTILRSHFERLERENTLPRFGAKAYRPDFGIPDLGILIEVKFLGNSTTAPKIQDEILADATGFLSEKSSYTGLIVFVYDASHQLLDPKPFVDDLKTIDQVTEVIVISGMG